MKIGGKERTVSITYQLGASGAMVRASLGKEVIALIRASQSRRVVVVRVDEKFGSKKEATFTWLDRALPQDYIQELENPSFDLYVDSDGVILQA